MLAVISESAVVRGTKLPVRVAPRATAIWLNERDAYVDMKWMGDGSVERLNACEVLQIRQVNWGKAAVFGLSLSARNCTFGVGHGEVASFSEANHKCSGSSCVMLHKYLYTWYHWRSLYDFTDVRGQMMSSPRYLMF